MVIAVIIGFVCGILSGFGIGGGTLLMMYMVNFTQLTQQGAQGINLIYFIPTSILALLSHIKNKLVDFKIAVPAMITGSVSTVGASFLASVMDTGILKKIFSVFLIIVGISELFKKQKKV